MPKLKIPKLDLYGLPPKVRSSRNSITNQRSSDLESGEIKMTSENLKFGMNSTRNKMSDVESGEIPFLKGQHNLNVSLDEIRVEVIEE